MEKLTVIRSVAAPLLLPNIDTDIIAPMKRILFHGDEIEKYGFEPLRFLDGDGDARVPNPEFPLNQERFRHAKEKTSAAAAPGRTHLRPSPAWGSVASSGPHSAGSSSKTA